jgi:polar amino acid transport system substrate-binding protein
MKIIKAIVLLFIALFLLTACAQMQLTKTNPSSSPVIDRIQERGELVVGMMGKMPPLNMTTKEGEVIGLEVDLVKMMSQAMGVKYRIETMPFFELLPALQEGKVDMVLSGMTITPDRNLKVAFVGPYFSSGKAFMTKIKTIAEADEPSDINSPNTKLVALRGSTSQSFAETFIPKATLWTANDYDEAVNMVLRDEVHAMVADFPICVVSLFRYPNRGLLSVITPITYEPLGIAVPAGDPLLVNWLENFLGSMEGSGNLEALKLKWFAKGSWLQRLP